LFCVHHLSNNKLGHRGKGVTRIDTIKKYLFSLKDKCLEYGGEDSFKLPEEAKKEMEEMRKMKEEEEERKEGVVVEMEEEEDGREKKKKKKK